MALTKREQELLAPAAVIKESSKKKNLHEQTKEERKNGRGFSDPRPVKTPNNSEWKCPFCMGVVSNGDKKCVTCYGVYRYQWGNKDFAYRSKDGRQADTLTIQEMKEHIEEEYGIQ